MKPGCISATSKTLGAVLRCALPQPFAHMHAEETTISLADKDIARRLDITAMA